MDVGITLSIVESMTSDFWAGIILVFNGQVFGYLGCMMTDGSASKAVAALYQFTGAAMVAIGVAWAIMGTYVF